MKLTKNSVSIVENIVDFTCALVFKDEVKAFEMETQESAVKASEYLSAYLKTDSLNEIDRKVIIDNYKELNKYYKELLDDYGIQPYISRLAKDLDIIYQPEKMILTYGYLYYYRAIYKQCLQSFYVTSYSPAMIAKDNYRELCLLSINLMAFVQLLNRWLENPYDINLMTEFQIDKFMISFGVSFFTGLPFKYKQIIARNLNRLIINKGTDKVVIDILELFGFSEININKYYLIRQAVTGQSSLNDNLDYRYTDTHDVFFISHNINLPSLNHAIKNDLYTKYTYEQIVGSDEYWNVSKEEVKSLDFNFVETKYFSIDTGFNLNVEVMNTTLIINLLKRIRTDYETKEKLEVLSNIISETEPAKLEDIIITLQILMCEYQGLEDIIQYDLAGIAKTYEFAKYDPLNINVDLMASNSKIKELEAISLADLRTYSKFDESDVVQIYTKNMKVKENLEDLINSEVDYHSYKKLRSAHNAKFYQTINYNMFGTHVTFTSYLRTRNSDLYNIVTNIKDINDTDKKNKALENMISNLTDIVTDSLQNFSIFLGATSLDILLSYMRSAILAFKSFTTSLLDLNVFIIVAETYETRLLDGIGRMDAICEHRSDLIQFEDKLKFCKKEVRNSRVFLNDLANVRVINKLFEYPLHTTLSFDSINLKKYTFVKTTFKQKDDYNIHTSGKVKDNISINSDKIINQSHLLQTELLSSITKQDKIAVNTNIIQTSLSANVDKYNFLLRQSLSSDLALIDKSRTVSKINTLDKLISKDNTLITGNLIASDTMIKKEITQFYKNSTLFSKSNVKDYLVVNKDRFFINKVVLKDIENLLTKLNINNSLQSKESYDINTIFTNIENITLINELIFHKDSVTQKLIDTSFLVEDLILTPYNINYNEFLIFEDTIKSKTSLKLQDKNYLNDNCIITQVTYK